MLKVNAKKNVFLLHKLNKLLGYPKQRKIKLDTIMMITCEVERL